MNAPADRCAYGHDYQADECTACEDLAAHHEARNAWCESDEDGRWHEMDEAEDALFASLMCKDFVLLDRFGEDLDQRYGRGFGVYGGGR